MSTLTGLIGGGGAGLEGITQIGDGVGNSQSSAVVVSGGAASFTTVLSVSDSGYLLSWFLVQTPGVFSTNANHRARLIIDGTTLITTPLVTINSNNDPTYIGQHWPGGTGGVTTSGPLQQVNGGAVALKFNTSLVIQHLFTGGVTPTTSHVMYCLD